MLSRCSGFSLCRLFPSAQNSSLSGIPGWANPFRLVFTAFRSPLPSRPSLRPRSPLSRDREQETPPTGSQASLPAPVEGRGPKAAEAFGRFSERPAGGDIHLDGSKISDRTFPGEDAAAAERRLLSPRAIPRCGCRALGRPIKPGSGPGDRRMLGSSFSRKPAPPKSAKARFQRAGGFPSSGPPSFVFSLLSSSVTSRCLYCLFYYPPTSVPGPRTSLHDSLEDLI